MAAAESYDTEHRRDEWIAPADEAEGIARLALLQAELKDFETQHEERSRPRVRAKTISIKRLSKRELERGRLLYPEHDYDRPKTRGECLHGPHATRPCPFVSCKHHIFLDVNTSTGSIKLNFPDVEVWDLPETCTLDIADRGGITLEEVGAIMNLTRERIRQVEFRALAKLKALSEIATLSDGFDPVAALDAASQPSVERRYLPVVQGPWSEEVFQMTIPVSLDDELTSLGAGSL